MARSGINKALVARARSALLARGQQPTIDAVRIELGNTGSKSTIHRYLREIDDESLQDQRSNISLSDELGTLGQQLGERLQQEAASELQQAREAFARERQDWQQQRNQYETRLQQAAEQYSAQTGELQSIQTALAASEAQARQQQLLISSLQAEGQGQQALLAQREQQISSLEDKHRHAREALEHFRNASQQQREQEQRRSEAERQQLQAELRQLQHGLLARQEQLVQMSRDNERLLGEWRSCEKQKSQAEDAAHQTQQALAAAGLREQQLTGELEGFRQQLLGSQQQREAVQQRLQDLDNRLNAMQQQLTASQAQRDLLERLLRTRPAVSAEDIAPDGQRHSNPQSNAQS